MYSVNGVDLQSSELEGLNLLVAAEGEVRVAVLLPRITFISRASLIKGHGSDGGFLFGGVTQRGFNFVDDYATVVALNKEEKR